MCPASQKVWAVFLQRPFMKTWHVQKSGTNFYRLLYVMTETNWKKDLKRPADLQEISSCQKLILNKLGPYKKVTVIWQKFFKNGYFREKRKLSFNAKKGKNVRKKTFYTNKNHILEWSLKCKNRLLNVEINIHTHPNLATVARSRRSSLHNGLGGLHTLPDI